MIALREVSNVLEVEPLDCAYNPQMAHSTHTNVASERRFSQVEISDVEQLAVERSELLSIRRQLLQGGTNNRQLLQEQTNDDLPEMVNNKGIIRKCFLALQRSYFSGLACS